MRDAAAIHFTSQAEQGEAESLGWPLRSHVIPLGIEPFDLPSPEVFLSLYPCLRDRRRILFLSRLDPKKNVETLLKAFAKVGADRCDIALVICGDGNLEYIAQLKELAMKLNIADSIVWAGNVGGEVKHAALACADLFVLPSFSENFGVAAVEALIAGVPSVLSHGVAVATEVAAAGAGMAVDPTPDAVAAGIHFYMSNPDKGLVARHNAQQLAAEKYSANAMSARLVSLYRNITANSSLKQSQARW